MASFSSLTLNDHKETGLHQGRSHSSQGLGSMVIVKLTVSATTITPPPPWHRGTDMCASVITTELSDQ